MVRPRERSARQLPPGVRTKQRAHGRVVWEVRWYDSDTGDRHSKYFHSADAAVEFWEDTNRAKRRGSAADPRRGRITFDAHARQWWEDRLARPAGGGSGQVRASTAARDASYLRNHALPTFGTWAIADITRQDVKAWVRELQAKNLAAATVAKNLQLLRACLEEARLDDLIAVNPAADVRPPTVERKKARFLTPDEFRRLEDAMDPWWQLTIPFLADTALRIGELADLVVQDVAVDISHGKATVTLPLHDLCDVDPDSVLGASVSVSLTAVEVPIEVSGAASRRISQPTKTRAGERIVPTITASVARRLVDHVAARQLSSKSPLFPGRDGAPISPSNWRKRVWDKAVGAADLSAPLPSPHAARHGGISLLIASGVTDPLRIAAYAGHASVNTVYDLYGHLLPTDPTEVRAALDRLRRPGRV